MGHKYKKYNKAEKKNISEKDQKGEPACRV